MMTDAPKQEVSTQSKTAVAPRDFTLTEAMKRPQYWLLGLIFTTVCMSGLYVIGVAKYIGENYVHLTMTTATTSVTIIAVANFNASK
ncbi:hypothetical protein [Psychromonas algarum]|uniref:hypothetical protein n=1 Tax=Psychromonas algarum TaxID=2555643 RepID=UPI001ABA24FF|nr:hypothetical protein [Psychromonas sp. RZ22]